MTRRPRIGSLLGVALGLFATVAVCHAGSALQVEATLTPQTIGIDETAQLTIRASGSGFGDVELRPSFHLDNLDVAAGPFESQQFEFSNGRASRSRSLSWQLKPRGVGDAYVRDIRVKVGADTMELPDQHLTVQEQPTGTAPALPGPIGGMPDPFARLFGRTPSVAPAPAPRGASPRVFLRAVVDPVDPYVGQQTTYTLYLFTQTSVSGVSPEALPAFHGFWVKEVPQPQLPTAATVELEGRRYRRVVLLQRALFPLRAGRQALDPVKVELQVQLPDGSPFGNLFPQLRRIERISNRVAVRVQPLPSPPADFSGAVGELRMESTINPTTLRVGDAATLQIRLHGSGHLQGLAAPDIHAPTGVEIFAPQGDTKEDMRGTRIDSERVWNYPVVPKQAGRWELPVPAFTYFDPTVAAYRTLAASHLALTATEAPESSTDSAQATTAAPSAPGASAPAAGGASTLRSESKLPWWTGAGALLLLGGLAWAVYARRRRHGGSRSKVDAGFLADLESIRRLHKPRQIARALEAAWRNLLGREFDLPAELEPTRWADHLSAQAVDRTLCDRLRHVTADLHYLRYAPELASVDTLRDELLQHSRMLARDLHR